ncbi:MULTISPECIES: hypothetical protein [unclassified Curtobacterium]|uniref:hypothetical protein n=1 Tax=unclassified Curtobacterium TaxID=257496 RepID=UPI00226B72E1|nr:MULTISPECIES: hypothetical protein [unclassified Curtobacterium]
MNAIALRTPDSLIAGRSREIAAAVTLPVAAAALVAPGTAPLDRRGGAAVSTACVALATRMALIPFIAAPADRIPMVIRPFDPFHDPTPLALQGAGPAPDRDRLRRAGDRCVGPWQDWRLRGCPEDERLGVAGALALGAWCSWALGSPERARARARHALDAVPTDALAGLVLRSVRARTAPAWWG